MARKFSDTQQRYLKWLSEGNSIHVLIECFSYVGKITYSSPPSFTTNKRALEGLKKAGMLKFEDEAVYGIRWTVVTLSEKAHEFMEAHS